MSRTLITPTRPVVRRARISHVVAAGLAAVVASGGAAIGISNGGPVGPATPSAAASGSIAFGDAPVVKGARGGGTNVPPILEFGDPTVRKGAGGR